MRNPRQFRPNADALENIHLMSAFSMRGGAMMTSRFVGPQPAAFISPVVTRTVPAFTAPAVNQVVQPSGTIDGTYRAIAGGLPGAVNYTFSGTSATVSPFGSVSVSGSLMTPGTATNDQAVGTLVLSNGSGSVTLSLLGAPQRRFVQVPNVLTYTVTASSGSFEGMTGTGLINLSIQPNAALNPTLNSTGKFEITFMKSSSPVVF